MKKRILASSLCFVWLAAAVGPAARHHRKMGKADRRRK